MLAKLYTFSLLGIDAVPVEVEVDVSPGAIPKTILVGLPEAAVRESTHRVERAIVNCGFQRPYDRVVINLELEVTTQTTLWAKEIETNPAGPALANTGMQDYFPPDHDPRMGRGTAVVIGLSGNTPGETELSDHCEFMANILRQEVDGLYHLDPANALETWWMVRDSADTLDAIRYLFPEFIRLSEVYGLDATLRSRCRSILAALPQPSVGKWHDDGRVDGSVDTYAPAAGKEACSLLVEHARRFNVFPYGGWHFNAHACHDKPFPHNRDFYTKPLLIHGTIVTWNHRSPLLDAP